MLGGGEMAKRGRVTLQSIADQLGVSRTTVSNAYGRPDQLNPELRARILEAAKRLGYTGPHPAARTLRSGRSGAVGVLITETLSYAFTDPAAVRFLEGIAQAGERAGIGLLLLPVRRGDDSARRAVLEAVVDGFIVYSLPDGHPAALAAVERRLPMVSMGEPRLEGAAFVGIDDRDGARRAAEHLVGLGHRRIAVISFELVGDGRSGVAGPERQAAASYAITRARLRGYADALRAGGLRWEDVVVQECDLNARASGEAAASALLDRALPPTAILATSDELAIGALTAAARRGVPVPEALSVVGFDDVPEAAQQLPALTTVRQPLVEQGRLAGELLLDPDREDGRREVLFPTELVVRASTGPPPIR
jgi:DNA-binding LacI/PurR family transcriptional regulator